MFDQCNWRHLINSRAKPSCYYNWRKSYRAVTLEHQIDEQHVDGGAGEDGQAGAALPGMQCEGDSGGDEGSDEAMGNVRVARNGGNCVDNEDSHHADRHGCAEELDNGAVLEQPQERKGEGTQEHSDDADGNEDSGDHGEGDAFGKGGREEMTA